MPSAQPQTDVEPAGAVRRHHRRPLLLPGCVVAGLALLAFAPVLRHDFVEGDDRSAIQHNPRLNPPRSEEHTSELQSRLHLVCRLLLEKKNIHSSKKIL